jgi:hypothetical protein
VKKLRRAKEQLKRAFIINYKKKTKNLIIIDVVLIKRRELRESERERDRKIEAIPRGKVN